MALTERQLALVERLLDDVEVAVVEHDWATVRARSLSVLAYDPENADALSALQNGPPSFQLKR